MIFKILKFLLIFSSLLIFLVQPVIAENKFGIHILETSDLDKASKLVNSSGGDWGHITIVLREDDMDQDKWQEFFNDCRKLHLIPIIRIATYMKDDYWTKPDFNDLEKWPKFLNSLNWPVKQQTVVIFNEPNHAKEWGGELNPEEYALALDKLIDIFKKENNNFFILNAGFDQAADGRNETMKEEVYLFEINQAVPNIFNKLDGWASHSYPNHDYIGLPEGQGKASINGFEWEIEILKSLGLNKELPVYITETGWPHKEGVNERNGFYESNKVAQLFLKAFDYWNKNNWIKSVTPFVLNYPLPPFDNFSWLKEDGTSYEQYGQVLGVSKTKNLPKQVESYQVIDIKIAEILPTNYLYKGSLRIKNTGQSIMGERDDMVVKVGQSEPELEMSQIKIEKGELINPDHEIKLDFTLETGTQSAKHKLKIGDNQYTIYIFKPFDLKNKNVSLWQQIKTEIKLWWLDFRNK